MFKTSIEVLNVGILPNMNWYYILQTASNVRQRLELAINRFRNWLTKSGSIDYREDCSYKLHVTII